MWELRQAFVGMHVRRCAWRATWLCLVFLAALPAQAAQTVRVGIYQNSPKVALAESGKPEGIFVDLLNDIAAQEDWQLQYVPGTWAEGLARLSRGDIDLMPDVGRNAERELLYAFHQESVLTNWNQVYVPKGSPIYSILDMKGKRVAFLAGSIQEHQLEQMAQGFNMRFQGVPESDYDAAFAAVAKGTADAVVTNRFFGARNAARYGLQDTAIVFGPAQAFYAVSLDGGDRALLATIDRHLRRYKENADSIYYQSLRRWAVDEVRTVVPAWLLPAEVAVVTLLLVSAAWLFLLKRQVVAKTREISRRKDEILAVNRTLRATGSQRELSVVLHEALQGALALLGFDGGVLCIRDEATGLLSVGAGIPATASVGRRASPGVMCDAGCPAMLEGVAKGRRRLLVGRDAVGVPQACSNVQDPTVFWNAYFPLTVQDRTVGVLCLFSRNPQAPPDHAMDLVEDLCGSVALAMENARLYEQAQAHAVVLEQRVLERTQELAETGVFLQAIIDHIANPIFYKGPDLRFRGCNRAYQEAFGVQRKDCVGKTVLELEFLPIMDRQAYQSEDAGVLAQGNTVHREAAIPFADGVVHQTLYSVSGFRRPDGVTSGLVGVIVDISAIKQTQAALKVAHDEQNAIFEAANSGIALIQNRVVRRCNQKLEQIFGYGPGELVDRPSRDWYMTEADYLRAGEQLQADVVNGATHRREERMVRKDGSRFWCRISVRALDPADMSRGLVGVIDDVTEERANVAALHRAKESAEAADRIKSAFLATMSHELRTPLNSIIGFTGIVLQGLAGPLTTEQTKQLGMVRDSSRHLLALINDVLDISKIEAGELKVGRDRFDLARSIQKVLAIVRPLADKKNLQLCTDIPDMVEPMVSDARRVEQVLLNLLSNAIKFTEKGQIHLKVEPFGGDAPARGSGVSNRGVRMSVSDTGMGIKSHDMEALFTPFRQIDSELSRKHDGTGLGLAICMRLAALMGGRVEATSVWGQGSTFTVTLPLEIPEQAEEV